MRAKNYVTQILPPVTICVCRSSISHNSGGARFPFQAARSFNSTFAGNSAPSIRWNTSYTNQPRPLQISFNSCGG
jgi:hypothetical protein